MTHHRLSLLQLVLLVSIPNHYIHSTSSTKSCPMHTKSATKTLLVSYSHVLKLLCAHVFLFYTLKKSVKVSALLQSTELLTERK